MPCRWATSSILTTWPGPSLCSPSPVPTSSRRGSSPGTGARTATGAGSSGRPAWHPRTGSSTGAARDVTAHHDAQGALGANEAWLQAILDHSTAGIFVKDRMGRYVLVNEAFLRASGLDREDVLGRTAAEIWPGAPIDDDDRRVLDDVKPSPRRRRPARGRPSRHDDGKVPPADASGAVTGMAAIATDITEWTQVQAALAERQRLLDTVIRACPDIVTVLDGKGVYARSARPRLGSSATTSATPSTRRSNPSSTPRTSPGSARSRPRSSPSPTTQVDLKYRVRHADGRWVVLDTRGQAMVGDDGNDRRSGRGLSRRDRRTRGRSGDARGGRGGRAGQQGQERLPVAHEP